MKIKTPKQLDNLAKLITDHYKLNIPVNLRLHIDVDEQCYNQLQVYVAGNTFEERVFTYFHASGIIFEIETCC